MNPNLHNLFSLSNASTRKIIGLMSGTSLDGLDIALVNISGHDKNTCIEVLEFTSVPYQQNYLDIIQPLFANPDAPLSKVCSANTEVAKIHANMLLNTLKEWQLTSQDIDLIASHGQTILHQPNGSSSSTMQIGDGDHLAHICRITTVSDFRQKHIAAGGEGAPLVPYADYLLFSDNTENRVLLNIGGISNFTFIPSNSDFNSVVSADTGPGNTLMDALVKAYSIHSLGYDENGAIAAQGKVNEGLLRALMNDPFFTQQSQRSTGPELFNLNWLHDVLNNCALNNTDFYTKAQKNSSLHNHTSLISHTNLLATLNRFTAQTIADAIKTAAGEHPTHVYVSGGGAYNVTLMKHLQALMPHYEIHHGDRLGIKASAKEAVLFAVLANQHLFGNCAIFNNSHNTPTVGLGKISLPD